MAEPAHTTSTAHTEGGHGAFPPFQSQTYASQLVWLAIAFVLLYVLMSKLALPRVGALIEGRRKHIEDDIAEAGTLKTKSEEAAAAYEKALADADSRIKRLLDHIEQADQADPAVRQRLNERHAERAKLHA